MLRQKRRSMAVIAQVAIAAGLAISFLALGQSITADIGQAISKLHFSVGVGEASGSGSQPFTSQAVRTAASTPGITGAPPVETSSVCRQPDLATWGLGSHPLYSYRLSEGHWFSAADDRADVVLGPVMARATSARVGQLLTLTMAAGPTTTG